MKKQGTREQGSKGTADDHRSGSARWRCYAGQAVLIAAAGLAVMPQVVWGNSCGHDFDFHLVSWLDALNGWRHGIVYPHWAASANYGAGEPRFMFYSPLTWMLGAALAAVIPWTWVPVALTFLLLAGTGLGTRTLARETMSEGAATLAGCVALFSGYALFTAYERTAFAELAGGLWIPLVLKYALRGGLEPSAAKVRFNRTVVLLALAIAGAWLSNPTVGVMACYTLAAVAVALLWLTRSWRPLVRCAAGAALGMGLIAVYLVPAAWEQHWVDIQEVMEDPGQTLENNWLFATHADPAMAGHDEVLHKVSMIAVGMIGLTLAGIAICSLRKRLPGSKNCWVPLALIPIAVLSLQFAFSRPVWNLLPDLRFLQFPWRWLLVLEPAMGIFAAAALWPRETANRWLHVAVAVAGTAWCIAMTAYAAHDLMQACDSEDTVPAMLTAYRSGHGFIGAYEYEPLGADNGQLAMNLPPSCLVKDAAAVLGKPNADGDPVWDASQGSCLATYETSQESRPEHLAMSAAIVQPGFLILRLRSFPAWQVKVNGGIVTALPRRADGLIAVPVPEGPAQINVDWTTTEDVIVARWLSALTVVVLVCAWLLARRRKQAQLS